MCVLHVYILHLCITFKNAYLIFLLILCYLILQLFDVGYDFSEMNWFPLSSCEQAFVNTLREGAPEMTVTLNRSWMGPHCLHRGRRHKHTRGIWLIMSLISWGDSIFISLNRTFILHVQTYLCIPSKIKKTKGEVNENGHLCYEIIEMLWDRFRCLKIDCSISYSL